MKKRAGLDTDLPTDTFSVASKQCGHRTHITQQWPVFGGSILSPKPLSAQSYPLDELLCTSIRAVVSDVNLTTTGTVRNG